MNSILNRNVAVMSDVAERFRALLLPMSRFYDSSKRLLPDFAEIDGSEMPEPYKSLLVHENDMTPTLEQYWGMKIHLRLLEKTVEDGSLMRHVVLEANGENLPVEYGAIRIYLDRFDERPRELILESYRPLGTILSDFEIKHSSHPSAYFRVKSDAVIGEALDMPAGEDLYGRCNVLIDAEGERLAEVIEVLPTITVEEIKE